MSNHRAGPVSCVSVVIPLYNKGLYIKRALDSVLAQTFQNFEVIVVNDGSTDDGPGIVRQIQDHRVHIIDQPNSGVSAARNRGISEAKSELIAFLDADDEWLPDFLKTVVGLADRFYDAGAYATGYLLLKGDGHVHRNITIKGRREKFGCYFDLFRKGTGICTSSSIAVRRSVFDRVGTFRVGYKLGEDLDMWFRIGLYYRFACSPKICALYHYYQPDNACYTTTPSKVSPLYISLLELKKDTDIDPVIKQKAMKHLSHQLAKGIEHTLLRGFRDVAKRRLRLYKMHCGFTVPYVKLYVMNMLPSLLLNSTTRIRLLLVRYMLMLRSMILKLCIS